ncbi:type VI secretion system accessory protein TagJ [Sulfitobacter mediterraneus]|uniref:Type VI secretion system protein ImpE n=1 Tax=Sulfitobacter mediterraneus TaxID=83219 RepID=A0A2T6C8W6_9RHOB|nr:type VI secretion system accessory protein TagJ [Sulfitobacter mediterraneus]KIN75705.1 Virulence protein, SciE type [Sulfitobacter mediterraneus KCTC 32188]PTX64768.1 type VI secretion system protein ImpE [Sulfitobacter mediterraneus]
MENTAQDLLKAGDLAGALAALQDNVRARPEDAKLRIFLFQLLCVQGNWERAIAQLKLCAQLDPSALPMAQTYREAIICEVFREKVFKGEKDALIFGEPQDWLALLAQALRALAKGDTAHAAQLREEAFEKAPAASGEIDGQDFEWIADADMRLGPVLEIVINGKYFWMPFNVLSSLRIEAPEDLRDTVWTAVNLTLNNGGELVGLVPTRYAGTVATGEDAMLLSRTTQWNDLGEGLFAGLGQRLLVTDAAEIPLMDARNIQFAAPSSAAPSSDGDEGDG